MSHLIAIAGLVVGVVVWFLLQRATGRLEEPCEEPAADACGSCGAPCDRATQP
jgi:hypothetical protein